LYLVDTDVISEAGKGVKANAGVRGFFASAAREVSALYLSVTTLGELRQGVERIRHRGDQAQAQALERWLQQVTVRYSDAILPFEEDAADILGRLRAANPEIPWTKRLLRPPSYTT
jgi:toxin FitB